MEVIKFGRVFTPYSQFSNFARTPIIINEIVYPTTEHYYQVMKFIRTDPDYAEKIRNSKTPKESKDLGHSRAHPLDKDWDDESNGEPLKIKVMRKALLTKFTQYSLLRNILLNTGENTILEDSPWDAYWGIGKNGKGKNMLGKLLMELRTKLKNEFKK